MTHGRQWNGFSHFCNTCPQHRKQAFAHLSFDHRTLACSLRFGWMVLFYVKHVIGRKLVGMRFGWEILVLIKGLLTQSVGTSYSRFHFHDSLCKQPVYFRQEAEMIDVKTMANSLELNFQRHLGALNLGWNLKLAQCYIWHKYRPNNQAVGRLCEAPEKQGKPRWDEKGGCRGSPQHPISQFTIGSKWKEHCALTRSTGHIATYPVLQLEILGLQKKSFWFSSD